MVRIVVTGTDTGVGKTVVSAMLTYRLKAHYWKPIQTGMDDDTTTVQQLVKCPVVPPVYTFPQPLAPLYAARLEGMVIEKHRLSLPDHTPLVIEGAGGVMVPCAPSVYYRDVMQMWGLPVVVVARGTLGTLNHTLLTLEALDKMSIHVAGLVINGGDVHHTVTALQELTDVPIMGGINHVYAIDKTWVTSIANTLKIESIL
jgi:dethiobiotin synthetase